MSVFRIRTIEGVRIPITTPLTRPYFSYKFSGAIFPRGIRGDVPLSKKYAFRARLATVSEQNYHGRPFRARPATLFSIFPKTVETRTTRAFSQA